MKTYSTITSKRQLTIPARVFHEASLKEGQKVLVSYQQGAIMVKPAVDFINKIAGSVPVPSRFQSMDIEELIRRAQKAHHQRI